MTRQELVVLITPAELDLLRRLALGRTMQQAAYELGLSESGLGQRMAKLREKLKMRTNLQIMANVARAGLV